MPVKPKGKDKKDRGKDKKDRGNDKKDRGNDKKHKKKNGFVDKVPAVAGSLAGQLIGGVINGEYEVAFTSNLFIQVHCIFRFI